jgi:hypothetical protein
LAQTPWTGFSAIWSNECATAPSASMISNHLRVSIDSRPIVPDGEWFKDFGSFLICGKGA